MVRLRIGILLIILSWFPFAQILIEVAHSNNKLSSEHSANIFRLAVWTVQFIIGLFGLWLAGKVVADQIKHDGWKRTPANVWRIFLHGE